MESGLLAEKSGFKGQRPVNGQDACLTLAELGVLVHMLTRSTNIAPLSFEPPWQPEACVEREISEIHPIDILCLFIMILGRDALGG